MRPSTRERPVADVAASAPATLAREVPDLRDPAWLTHLREVARLWRGRGRVHRGTQGLWLLPGHADGRAMTQSAHLSRDPRPSTAYPGAAPLRCRLGGRTCGRALHGLQRPSNAHAPAAVRDWRDRLIAAQRNDPAFDDQRLAHPTLLFIAGHETTTNPPGNGR